VLPKPDDRFGSKAGMVDRRADVRCYPDSGPNPAEPIGLVRAESCLVEMGRACLLCPLTLDINLFRYGKGVIDLDAEITHGALDFRVPE
jgi:hypothetical protein